MRRRPSSTASRTPPPSPTPSPSAAPSPSPSASPSPISTTDWVVFTSDRHGNTVSYPPTHTGIAPCTVSAPTFVAPAQRDFTFGADVWGKLGDENTPLDLIVYGGEECGIAFFSTGVTLPDDLRVTPLQYADQERHAGPMRSIEYYIILTADGMYADADGGLDHYDPADDEHRYANELLRTAGAEVMGRKMYKVMSYWDRLDVDDPATPEVGAEFARYWRETPKLVVSRGHPELGPNATKIEGDVVEAVRALKSTDGPPIGVGAGADLFATLAEAGLIDRYRWLVIPKAIGRGKSLFSSLTRPLDLRLVGTRTFDSGAVLLEYEPAS